MDYEMKIVQKSCDKCNAIGNCVFEILIDCILYDICGSQCLQKLVASEIEKLNGKTLMIAVRKV